MNIEKIFLPFAISFITIGLAELGDKTQLLSIGFAAKYKLKPVIAGIVAAASVLMLTAVLLGKVIAEVVPLVYIELGAALIFITFGVWIILAKQEGGEEVTERRNHFWSVFGGFFLAELGDKTQLAAITLAATFDAPIQVWIGSSSAMILVNMVGITIGNRLQAWLPPRVIKYAAAFLFIIFGLVTLGKVLF